ncbi:MAG TPA: hypothetical protein VMY78_05400 [Solirubrobacteraceae bacterium]|nr:hypothetical protein [Solirubrobacteraceae bacterium]
MPVTSFAPHNAAASAPPAPAAAGPSPPAVPADGAVGHGVTRLFDRPPAWAHNYPFIPGTPPPRGETAGAHGDHKGRISIR